MSAVVKIPTPLRRVTNGKDSATVTAGSLRDSLNQLDGQFPGLKERLIDATSGELHRFVNIYVNGEDVRFLQGMQTVLKDGDEISIVPAVAGGC